MPQDESQEAHKVRITFDNGQVTIYIDGAVFAMYDQDTFDPEKQRVCALTIDTAYPCHGSAPEVWIQDLTLNGAPVELYTNNWDPWRE